MNEDLKANESPEELLWTLSKVDGYMDLGMWEKAEALMKHAESHAAAEQLPAMIHVRLRLAMHRNDWPEAARLARIQQQAHPDQAQTWISLAFALRRAEGIPAARDILLEAEKQFPGEPILGFNLACYDCVEGNTGAAVKRLEALLHRHPGLISLILQDEDLAEIRHMFE